ncbi:MAG: hypothetical protein N2327_06150 [Caldimicrobium sp.]|nr:hypothetical protein [Caldimicrobium sp.]MCX7873993.1 hypothetical protein [Caldimicrobium sp.]MDW8094141.1 hypothetical protein [Caldimicrobium sp.]
MESLKKLTLSLQLPPKIKENLKVMLHIKELWGKLFREKANQIVPLYFQDETLYIGVDDHYELQELQINYLGLLEKMKGLYPSTQEFPIKNLRFVFWRRVGERGVPSWKISFSPEDWRSLKLSCSEIKDPYLRQLFQRLIKSYIRVHTSDSISRKRI